MKWEMGYQQERRPLARPTGHGAWEEQSHSRAWGNKVMGAGTHTLTFGLGLGLRVEDRNSRIEDSTGVGTYLAST